MGTKLGHTQAWSQKNDTCTMSKEQHRNNVKTKLKRKKKKVVKQGKEKKK
jgi:hypothetical protein